MDPLKFLEQNFSTLSTDVQDLKVLIAAGFTKVDSNFDSIKKEIDSLHSKVEQLNNKVEALKGTTTDGFGEVGLKLENLTEEITKISVVTSYDEQYKNLEGLN